jgi:hypothetical protein
MTKFIAVTYASGYVASYEGPAYIRADKIVSAVSYRDNITDTGGATVQSRGTLITYENGSEGSTVFAAESPEEVHRRIDCALKEDRTHTAQEWIDIFVNNIPAIDGAFTALKNR